MSLPIISIVLPVYNGMKYLKESINSVLEQEFTSFELLILNDCSTDDSWRYLNSIKDDRVKLFNNDVNKGLFFNLNFLIQQSTASLIKLWAQDDIMHPNCIKEIVQFHLNNPEIGFSYTGRDYMYEDSVPFTVGGVDITPSIIYKEMHARIAFFTGSIAANISIVTLNKMALKNSGLFNQNMKISGDFEMYVRLAKEYPIGFIREKLVLVREHKEQLSKQEKYYIYLLKEDIIAYNYLFSYLNKSQRKEGRHLLRNHKLLYFYTLMIKAFFKGHFIVFYIFFRTLKDFDNIILLSFYFIRNRILLPKKFDRFELFKK
jgi:glycosyltransferase involved in cell wall biosynthesis